MLKSNYNWEYMMNKTRQIVKGKEFKYFNPHILPCKVIGKNENNFKYSIGLNKDTHIMKTSDLFSNKGLHFTDITYIHNYISVHAYENKIALLKINNYDDIYIEYSDIGYGYVYKPKQLFITRITTFDEYFDSLDNNFLLKLANDNFIVYEYLSNKKLII